MLAYVARRLPYAAVTVVLVSVFAFLFLAAAGDPTYSVLGSEAGGEDLELLRRQLGLDRPLAVRFLEYARGALRGDFGDSLYVRGRTAPSLIADRVGATLVLGGAGVVLALALAVPLGVVAAVRRNSAADLLASFLAFFGQAMPSFWLGILLIMVFAVNLRWLPESGYGTARHLVLPSITLALYLSPIFMRLTRSKMLDVLRSDYVRTARAKGSSEWVVLGNHALRNAAIPLLTMLGLQTGRIVGGIVVVETVFGWPGVASLIVDSVRRFDYPVVQAGVLFLTLAIVASNLVADILVAWVDPRVRYGGRS